MKKYRTFLTLLALMLLVPIGARSQETLTVADGTVTSNYYPVYGFYLDGSARSEVLYPASLLEDMVSGSIISGVKFYNSYYTSSSYTFSGSIQMRMQETESAAYASTAFISTTDAATLVYTGTLTIANGEMSITLDNPYTYQGGNLIIDFQVGTSATCATSSCAFKGITTEDYQGAYAGRSLTTPTSRTKFLPKVTFEYTPGGGNVCYTPAAVTPSDTTTNSVTITVTEREGVNASYELQYKLASASWDNESDVTTINMTGLSETLSNLSSNTVYNVRVRTVCSADNMSGWKNVTIRTACEIVSTLPFVTVFDDWTEEDPCWNYIHTGTTNATYPKLNTMTANPDGVGTTPKGLIMRPTAAAMQYVVMPEIESLSGNSVSFFADCNDTNMRLDVGVMDANDDTASFVLLATFTPGSVYRYCIADLNEYTGEGKFIAFRGRNLGTATTKEICIDNVKVMPTPSCARALGVSVRNITENSAEVVVDDPLSNNNYSITLYGENDTVAYPDNYTDTVFTLTDLTHSSLYTLQLFTVCDDQTVLDPVFVSFRTACAPVTVDEENHFTENFESYSGTITNANAQMPCWNFIPNGNTNGVNHDIATTTARVHGGGKSLRIYPNGTADNTYAVLPVIENIAALEMSIWIQAEDKTSSGHLYIGYMTDPNDPTTFVSMGDFSGVTYDDVYRQEFITFVGAPENARIAIRHNPQATNYYWWIDDIDVHPMPACTAPTATLTEVTSTTATLSIIDPNDVNNYTVTIYQDTISEPVDSVTVTENTYILQELEVNTPYRVVVRTICNGEPTERASEVSFRTNCEAEEFPFHHTQADMRAMQTDGFTTCWRYTTGVYRTTSTATGQDTLGLVYISTAGAYLVLPVIDVELNNAQLRTLASTTADNASFCVGVVEGSNVVWIDTVKVDKSSNLRNAAYYEVNLSAYEGTGNRIAVGVPAAKRVNFFDVHVEEPAACPAVRDLSVSEITSSSATISWTPMGSESAWLMIINGDTVEDIYEASITIDTLQANTAYAISVAALCDDTSYVRNVSFRTLCGNEAIPYFNNFENETTSTNIACWKVLHGTVQPVNGAANAYSGSQYLKFSGASASTGGNMIVMPPFDQELNTLQVRFMTRPESTTNASCGTFSVGYVTNADSASTFVALQTYSYSDFTAYEEKEVSMASAPEGARVAFRHDPTSTVYYWYVDNLNVEPIPVCARPESVSARDIEQTSATVVIGDIVEGRSYHLVVKQGTNTVFDQVISDTLQDLTDLTANTLYNMSVTAICSDESETNPTVGSFRTACGLNPVPWTEGFEGFSTTDNQNTIPCWDFSIATSSTSNTIKISTTASRVHDGAKSLQFNGNGSDAIPTLAILPPFVEEISTLEFSCWALSENNSNSGKFVVGYVVEDDDTTEFVAVDTIVASDATTAYFPINVTFADAPEGARIAFGQMSSANMWWWVDDIDVHAAPSCQRPDAVVVSNITPSTATVTVNDEVGTASAYSLLVTIGDSTVVEQNFTGLTYELEDLTPGTDYKVSLRGVCSDEGLTAAVLTSFHTPCLAIPAEELPWSEGFESYPGGTTSSATVVFDNPCWNVINRYSTTTPYVYQGSSYAHSGTQSLNFYGKPGTIMALPNFETPVSNLMLTFWARTVNAAQAVEVGYMTNPADASTFVLVQSCSPATTGTYQQFEVTFPEEATGFIAMRYYYTYSGYALYVDDITVDEKPSCMRPNVITVSDVDESSATVTLADPNELNHYALALYTGTTLVDSVEVTGNSHEYTTLQSSTSYTLYAYTICTEGNLVAAQPVNFSTTMLPAALPYSTGFEAGQDAGWQFANGTNGWFIGSAASNGGTNGMYISNNNGTANAYTNSSSTVSYAHKLFAFDEGTYTMTFDWRSYGENNYNGYDYLRVFVVPGAMELNADDGSSYNSSSTPAGCIASSAVYEDQNTWQSDTLTIDVTSAGNYNVVFYWHNDATGGENPPAAIDNISISLNGDVPPVGIDEVEAADIVLFPNPATSNVTLRGVEAGSQVSVVDMNGRMVRDFKAANDNVRIDVSNLAKGAYFVRVVNGNTNAIRKLIVK